MSASNKKSLNKQRNLPVNLDDDEVIRPEVAKVIRDLPADKQKVIIQALSVSHHSGPLPSADVIKVYAEVIPDGGDRLMKSVEKQLDHRVGLENYGIKRSFNQSSTGQWMAFCLAALFGIGCWDLAKSGHETAATILGSIDIVALVTVFIVGRSKSS